MNLKERLTRPGPKRILALDGGGIRGCLTLGFLERIETVLRERHNNPQLRLCEYFDLIGGTSTGAIIAACLAIGHSIKEIKAAYLTLGERVFAKKKIKIWEARFDARPLRQELCGLFGDVRLGDETVRTGLCIVAKRMDTWSTWPVFNHPDGQFYRFNKDILVRDMVRASAAAPVMTEPEVIDVGFGEQAVFVDGGVSMCNNPALQLFLAATLQGYPFHWDTGHDKLLLVSCGTGHRPRRMAVDKAVKSKVWDWAVLLPGMLIEDANWQAQLLLQYLSRTQTPVTIDSEIGNLANDVLGGEPALSYVRYDVCLSQEDLARYGFHLTEQEAADLHNMAAADNRFALADVGARAGERLVQLAHFPPAFDLGATLI